MIHLPDGRTVAVHNPCNDPGRTNSDIGHELAHILLDHDVREIQQIAGHTFITCNPEQEEEATWLAGCLLLPRSLLLREAYNGTSAEDIADKYQVSPHMARFRLNTSGVLLQARRTSHNIEVVVVTKMGDAEEFALHLALAVGDDCAEGLAEVFHQGAGIDSCWRDDRGDCP